jgi:hypothetical protein
MLDQLDRQRRQPFVAALRPAVFDRYVLTLDVAAPPSDRRRMRPQPVARAPRRACCVPSGARSLRPFLPLLKKGPAECPSG